MRCRGVHHLLPADAGSDAGPPASRVDGDLVHPPRGDQHRALAGDHGGVAGAHHRDGPCVRGGEADRRAHVVRAGRPDHQRRRVGHRDVVGGDLGRVPVLTRLQDDAPHLGGKAATAAAGRASGAGESEIVMAFSSKARWRCRRPTTAWLLHCTAPLSTRCRRNIDVPPEAHRAGIVPQPAMRNPRRWRPPSPSWPARTLPTSPERTPPSTAAGTPDAPARPVTGRDVAVAGHAGLRWRAAPGALPGA